MRVLITGARGQVGTELVRLRPEWVKTITFDSQQLDISNARAVYKVIETEKPALIINAGAYTAVDRAESDQSRAYAVNGDGPVNLARAAEKIGIPFFHISTDYVFSGNAQRPYQENSAVDPNTVYGRSKLMGEQGVVEACSQYIILRTSWVFAAHGTNFVRNMLRLGDEKQHLRVVSDQCGGPTSAASIARALWSLVHKYHDVGSAGFEWGIFHYSGAPATTWHAFAKAIFNQAQGRGILERVPSLEAITTEEYPTPARRPAYSVLDCSRILTMHDIPQSDWRDELESTLLEIKKGCDKT